MLLALIVVKPFENHPEFEKSEKTSDLGDAENDGIGLSFIELEVIRDVIDDH
jgi:hypothetical protein